jgi:hypothetical protein
MIRPRSTYTDSCERIDRAHHVRNMSSRMALEGFDEVRGKHRTVFGISLDG